MADRICISAAGSVSRGGHDLQLEDACINCAWNCYVCIAFACTGSRTRLGLAVLVSLGCLRLGSKVTNILTVADDPVADRSVSRMRTGLQKFGVFR